MDKNDMYRVAEGVNLELVASRIETATNKSKKTSKKGAFIIFVDEHMETWRNEGKNVSTMRDAVEIGDIEWRKLSVEEKTVYKEKAKPPTTTVPLTVVSVETKEERVAPLHEKFHSAFTLECNQEEKDTFECATGNAPTMSYANENQYIVRETRIEASRIKPLSIIYEENEQDLSCSENDIDCNTLESDVLPSTTGATSSYNMSTQSIDDMKIPLKGNRNIRRNLRYPLRKPSNASLMAARKLNFNSSEENVYSNRDDSVESSSCIIVSPDVSSNYEGVKSSSPIKDNRMKSDLCDISPIKVGTYQENQFNGTTSNKSTRQVSQSREELVSNIEKLMKQAQDLMNDSLWDIVY